MEWKIGISWWITFYIRHKDHFEYILKKHGKKTASPSVRTYTFKIKTGYYLRLLTPETMKLHRRTKYKITKDENGKSVLYLEITEVV